MKMRYNIIVSLLLLFGTACSGVDKCLDKAESFMMSNPDSSLIVLRQIDTTRLAPATHARYALLYSQALDKCHIDCSCDRLIRVATDYYAHYGTSRQRLMAFYYLARVYRNGGRDIDAMLSLLTAEKYIADAADHYTAGLVYTLMGNIYTHYYDYTKAYASYSEAYSHYIAAELFAHQGYALLDMGRTALALGQMAQCCRHLDDALANADERGDTTLHELVIDAMIILADTTEEYDRAFELITSSVGDSTVVIHAPDVLGAIAHVYSIKGDYALSDRYMEQGWQSARTKVDSITLSLHQSRIYHSRNNLLQSYITYNRSVEDHAALLREALQNPIVTARYNDITHRAKLDTERHRTERKIACGIAVVVVVIAILVAFAVRFRIRRKDAQIAQYMAVVGELKTEAHNQEIGLSILMHQYFDILEDLGNSYYECTNNRRKQEAVYKKVKCVIDNLSNDPQTIKQLESTVNRCKGDVMTHLRNEYPMLKEDDYRFLCYIYAGFSARIVALLLNETINNVYKRKSRLKLKISESDTPHRQLLLDAMSRDVISCRALATPPRRD